MPAFVVFACVWSAQQRGIAQTLGIITLNPAPPENEFLIHAAPDTIDQVAARHNLQVLRRLDVPPYDVFLVRAADVATNGTGTATDVTPQQKVSEIEADPAVAHVELNAVATAPEVPSGVRLDQSPVSILDALAAPSLVNFGGVQVWNSYLDQPAGNAIHLPDSRAVATGAGVTVAVIDTGVDQHHPVLQTVLVEGYDFIEDVAGPGSEWTGVDPAISAVLDQSPVSILDSVGPVALNPSTLAILDQPRANALSTVQMPAAFGHGTMVAGVVHLVAPAARIMPLKAFSPTGTSRVFDIVRAIYYAVDHGARVINMSFSTAAWSPEITHAINTATDRGVICVASAGNLGQEVLVYPGAHRNVIGVGSTSSAAVPARSTFSNFGDALVSLAAPGESVITTYPGGTYAGAWGTSFSAPMVAGAAALLLQIDPTIDHSTAAALLGKGDAMVRSGLGGGRLNLSGALRRVTDSTAPSVSFTRPASGLVTKTVSVAAVATDNVGVAGVSFLLDDQPLGAEATVAPYEIAWNTIGVSNGAHVLTAVARDRSGNKSTATLSVTVTNDVTAPTVAITAPGGGSVTDAVTLSAAASDDAEVVGVLFKLDGAPLGQEDTAAPYQIAWNTASIANGAHVLTATARDAAGHSTTSAPVSVTIANDFDAPTVSLLNPGASVGGSVTVTASAADDVGVAGVQFLLDGAALGAEDTTAPYSVAWNTAGLSNGQHVLTAVARDAAGRSTTSTNVNVTVANDVTAPQIALSTAGGSVSGTITLAATASDDFGVTGVQFTVDGIPVGVERTSAPYEFAWDSSTESNGVHVLAAVARDAAGHTTTASSVSVSVTNDLAAPVVALSTTSGTVSGSVTIAATASDDIGVAGVQFKLDGVALGPEHASAPYEVAWDTVSATNGVHVLTAVARDAAGRTSTASTVEITVLNDIASPVVALTTASGSVSGNLTLAANASDDIGVVAVQFEVDGVAVGAAHTSAPYELAWDSATAANGVHVVTAVARDAAGHVSRSAPVGVTVLNDLAAPVVALTTQSGAVSGSVTIAANAFDDVGVTAVEFLVDGAAVGEPDAQAPYEFAWDSGSAANGTHTVTAVARDGAGRTTTATPVTLVVSNDTTAPTIALSTAGGTISGSLTITAAASDDIGVVGVQFFVDGEPLGNEDTTAAYDVAWDTTTAANGTHVLTAVARDAAGRTTAAEPVTVTVANDPLN